MIPTMTDTNPQSPQRSNSSPNPMPSNNELAQQRTGMAQQRTDMAEQRTGMSTQRTELAQERTALAANGAGQAIPTIIAYMVVGSITALPYNIWIKRQQQQTAPAVS
jgi:uncharacterized membrane protein YidH (DUF202 family)